MILAIDIPTDLIIFIVAAVIAIITKAVEASRAVRKRSLEKQQEMDAREGVDLAGLELAERPPTPRPAPRRIELPRPPEPVAIPAERARPRAPRRIRLDDAPPPPPAEPVPVVPDLPTAHTPRPDYTDLVSSLADRDRLREAVLLKEILGPPKALRRRPS